MNTREIENIISLEYASGNSYFVFSYSKSLFKISLCVFVLFLLKYIEEKRSRSFWVNSLI